MDNDSMSIEELRKAVLEKRNKKVPEKGSKEEVLGNDSMPIEELRKAVLEKRRSEEATASNKQKEEPGFWEGVGTSIKEAFVPDKKKLVPTEALPEMDREEWQEAVSEGFVTKEQYKEKFPAEAFPPLTMPPVLQSGFRDINEIAGLSEAIKEAETLSPEAYVKKTLEHGQKGDRPFGSVYLDVQNIAKIRDVDPEVLAKYAILRGMTPEREDQEEGFLKTVGEFGDALSDLTTNITFEGAAAGAPAFAYKKTLSVNEQEAIDDLNKLLGPRVKGSAYVTQLLGAAIGPGKVVSGIQKAYKAGKISRLKMHFLTKGLAVAEGGVYDASKAERGEALEEGLKGAGMSLGGDIVGDLLSITRRKGMTPDEEAFYKREGRDVGRQILQLDDVAHDELRKIGYKQEDIDDLAFAIASDKSLFKGQDGVWDLDPENILKRIEATRKKAGEAMGARLEELDGIVGDFDSKGFIDNITESTKNALRTKATFSEKIKDEIQNIKTKLKRKDLSKQTSLSVRNLAKEETFLKKDIEGLSDQISKIKKIDDGKESSKKIDKLERQLFKKEKALDNLVERRGKKRVSDALVESDRTRLKKRLTMLEQYGDNADLAVEITNDAEKLKKLVKGDSFKDITEIKKHLNKEIDTTDVDTKDLLKRTRQKIKSNIEPELIRLLTAKELIKEAGVRSGDSAKYRQAINMENFLRKQKERQGAFVQEDRGSEGVASDIYNFIRARALPGKEGKHRLTKAVEKIPKIQSLRKKLTRKVVPGEARKVGYRSIRDSLREEETPEKKREREIREAQEKRTRDRKKAEEKARRKILEKRLKKAGLLD